MLLLRSLLILSFVTFVYGGGQDNVCTTVSDHLYKEFNNITISGKITCDGKPLYAAYIQLADNFQAVNDVIAHGHSDRNGEYIVKAPFYYYSDTDLAPPKGSWKIIIYSYCGIPFEKKNHCHRVTKQVLVENNDCLQWDAGSGKPREIKMPETNVAIPKTPPTGDKNDKSICLVIDDNDDE